MVDHLLPDHVGLLHVLHLAVHLDLTDWIGRGDHSETFSLLSLSHWSTPSWLKVIGGGVVGWWGGGLCDYCVTPVPIEFGFGFRTALGLGLGLRGPDLGLGLTICPKEIE